ncbi:MAG: hypothetical protein SF069_03275 [Phycisphaerae bacterium]|nr:hypothetical protein [Phycisphaerae bacterium]
MELPNRPSQGYHATQTYSHEVRPIVLYLLSRPTNVPGVMWRSTRPLRAAVWLLAVVPFVICAAGTLFDVIDLARRGSVPGDSGRFLQVWNGMGRVRYLPTRLSVAGFAIAVTTAASGAAAYAYLKRRLYHRVWKSGFAVCLHCGERLPGASGVQTCPVCGSHMPYELHRAWKDWYESTWDEDGLGDDRPDLSDGPGQRGGRWM